MPHWYHGALRAYDRLYRFWHGLDDPHAFVPPLLRVEVRRTLHAVVLSDGARVRPGEHVGLIHLDNAAVATLHAAGVRPPALGLQFRRRLVTSLRALAHHAEPGGRFADVAAFAAITIFHRGLVRVGFEFGGDALRIPWLTARYQRLLLASLHPDGAARSAQLAARRAERVWISRARLRALHGARPTVPPPDQRSVHGSRERSQ